MCLGPGCRPRINYQSLGSDFYWFNEESPSGHAPNTHLVVKSDEKYVEIGQGIVRWAPPFKGDYLVYAAGEANGRKEGLYVFKKLRGSKLLAPGLVAELEIGLGGVKYRTTGGDSKTLPLEEVEQQFK